MHLSCPPRYSIAPFLPQPPLFGATPIAASANTAPLFGATPIAASANTAPLLRYWPQANTRNWRVYFSEIRRALFDFDNVCFVSIYNDTLSIPNPLFVRPP